MKFKRILAVILSVGVVFASLAGCSGKAPGGTKDEPTAKASPSSGGVTLPIVKQPLKVTFYTSNYQSQYVKSYAEVECYKEIAKRTGIDIEWVHPTSSDQLSLTIASGDLPDLIFNNWGSSISKYVDDGVAVKLNDYIDKFAPDIKKIFAENPNIKKQLMLDDGTIPLFPQLDMDLRRNIYKGFLMRGDWLEKLNLKAPTTIDEWYTVLRAFKEKDPNGNGKPDDIPYTDEKGAGIKMFSGAWGVRETFAPDPKTGKLVYGPMELAYRDYLSTMAKWFKEGLIDPEYGKVDRKELDTRMLGELVGSTFGTNGYIESYMASMKDKNPTFRINGVPFPVGPAGKSYNTIDQSIRHISGYGTIMTKSCKHPEEVTKLCNYMMSEEGTTLQNWGIEGKSYVVENGKKKYTDEIMKNKEGVPPSTALVKYAIPNGLVKAFIYENYADIHRNDTPGFWEAEKVWGAADKSLLMPVQILSYEENQRYTALMGEINTYVNQMFTKFVTGAEPIDKFDEYVKALKKIGIDDALKIQQDAYERFKARK